MAQLLEAASVILSVVVWTMMMTCVDVTIANPESFTGTMAKPIAAIEIVIMAMFQSEFPVVIRIIIRMAGEKVIPFSATIPEK